MKIFMDGPPGISYGRYKEHVNEAINLLNVTWFKRSNIKYYPDNAGFPSIRFGMTSMQDTVNWIFEHERDRDAKYQELLNMRFPGTLHLAEPSHN